MNILSQLAAELKSGETIDGIVVISGDQVISNILNIAYFIAGIIAVIVIIIAGMMYTGSSGDAQAVSRAKNLMLYSIVGLIVIGLAFAITNFVTGRF